MEPLNKLLLLAVLGAVAALLVFLLRQAFRESSTSTAQPERVESKPVDTEPPIEMKREEPVVAMTPQPAATIPEEPIALTPAIPVVAARSRPVRRKRKPAPATAAALPSEATPIGTVLELLKRKDSLPAAFLLREIFGPPVSKR
jgi:hypothetical protein